MKNIPFVLERSVVVTYMSPRSSYEYESVKISDQSFCSYLVEMSYAVDSDTVVQAQLPYRTTRLIN